MPHYYGPDKDPLTYSHTASDCPSSLGAPLAPQGEVRLGRVKGISWGKPTPSPHPRKMSKSSSSLLLLLNCAVVGAANQYSHCGKKYGVFLKNKELPYDPAIPGHIYALLGIYL